MNPRLRRSRSSANLTLTEIAPETDATLPPTSVSSDSKRFTEKTIQKLHLEGLVLKNTGLVARDHLANERTFLAWIRTGLVMMTLGLAFMQMYSIQTRAETVTYKGESYTLAADRGVAFLATFGKPFGICSAAFAIAVVVFGLYRFLAVQASLQENEFPATRVIVVVVTAMCLALMALVVAMDIKEITS